MLSVRGALCAGLLVVCHINRRALQLRTQKNRTTLSQRKITSYGKLPTAQVGDVLSKLSVFFSYMYLYPKGHTFLERKTSWAEFEAARLEWTS